MEEVDTSCTRCAARRMIPVNAGWRGEWRCDCGQANTVTELAARPNPVEVKAEREKAARLEVRRVGGPRKSPKEMHA